jgi:hypothetical protein
MAVLIEAITIMVLRSAIDENISVAGIHLPMKPRMKHIE